MLFNVKRAVVLSLSLSLCSHVMGQPDPRSRQVERSDRTLLVRWEDVRAAERARRDPPPLLAALGGRVDWISQAVPGMAVIEVEPGLADAAETLLPVADSFVFVERDYTEPATPTVVPNDVYYPLQWNHDKLCMPAAWDVIRDVNPNEIITVLDSGVRYTLAELAPNLLTNPADPGVDDNNDGIPDDDDNSGVAGDYWGACFVTDPADGCINPPHDPFDHTCSHGTYMASIIDAVTNNLPQNSPGMAGTAWTCKMLAVQVWGQTVSAVPIVKGIEYATWARGSRLVNISNVWSFNSAAVKAIIGESTDALFVVSAGNDATDLDYVNLPSCPPVSYKAYPAMYPYDNLLVVAGSTPTDEMDGLVDPCPDYEQGSNNGAISVDVFGPSLGVYGLGLNGVPYASWGTSNATAITTALAALRWTQDPTLTPVEVKQKILNSAEQVTALNGLCVSGARVNGANLLASGCP